MTSLENKVLQCASGEKRFKPDELRQYFGTFAERVVLAILLENVEKPSVMDHFPKVLEELLKTYPHLTVKLSPKLSDQTQFAYIKIAQKCNTQATIVDEAKADSPYGLIVHSDKAEHLDEILFCNLYPDYIFQKESTPKKEKIGFFAKHFHKK